MLKEALGRTGNVPLVFGPCDTHQAFGLEEEVPAKPFQVPYPYLPESGAEQHSGDFRDMTQPAGP